MPRIAMLAAAFAFLPAWGPPVEAQSVGAAPPEAESATDRTREILEAYWVNHDPSYVAEDAVFTMMPTGEEIRGRDEIARHLHHFYQEAFDAKAERASAIFGENSGLLEAMVVGKHTGEFAGIAATGREIKVPLSVAYEIENDQITRARIYLMVNVLLQQIGPSAAASP
ncbi:hypothetical protein BH23GEM2_BH23GEM2_25800 [soil metagenome]